MAELDSVVDMWEAAYASTDPFVLECEDANSAVALRSKLHRYRKKLRETEEKRIGSIRCKYDDLIIKLDGKILTLVRITHGVKVIGKAPEPQGLCQWCAAPCYGDFCCVEHEELSKGKKAPILDLDGSIPV